MKLIGMVTMFNESSRGNLRRCLDNMRRYCDEIAVFDDGSEDDSVAVAKEYTPHVLERGSNNYLHETRNRQKLLAFIMSRKPDYVLWLDADEIMDKRATEGGIRALCETGLSYEFDMVNIWRSTTWQRMDYLGHEWKIRLWKSDGKLSIPISDGLHQQVWPGNLTVGKSDLLVLHFGYATREAIERRWRERSLHNVPIPWRRKGVDERGMKMIPVPLDLFPSGIDVPANEPMPTPISYAPDIMREAGLV